MSVVILASVITSFKIYGVIFVIWSLQLNIKAYFKPLKLGDLTMFNWCLLELTLQSIYHDNKAARDIQIGKLNLVNINIQHGLLWMNVKSIILDMFRYKHIIIVNNVDMDNSTITLRLKEIQKI